MKSRQEFFPVGIPGNEFYRKDKEKSEELTKLTELVDTVQYASDV